MKEVLKEILAKAAPYRLLKRWAKHRQAKKQLAVWERDGKPAPPPHIVKQRVLREFGQCFGLSTLVETGTFYGDMVEAMRADFDHIYSIELSDALYMRAQSRFASVQHVTLVHGDSSVVLESVLNKLQGPALFWLDGHYSAGETARGQHETPILAELHHILAYRDLDHVIVIDDARNFGVDPSYPSLQELRDFVIERKAGAIISVEFDSIRIVPAALAVPC